jgi:hypothetical protein
VRGPERLHGGGPERQESGHAVTGHGGFRTMD